MPCPYSWSSIFLLFGTLLPLASFSSDDSTQIDSKVLKVALYDLFELDAGKGDNVQFVNLSSSKHHFAGLTQRTIKHCDASTNDDLEARFPYLLSARLIKNNKWIYLKCPLRSNKALSNLDFLRCDIFSYSTREFISLAETIELLGPLPFLPPDPKDQFIELLEISFRPHPPTTPLKIYYFDTKSPSRKRKRVNDIVIEGDNVILNRLKEREQRRTELLLRSTAEAN